MTTTPTRHTEQFALQLIYSAFLGVMFAAFIGIGVWTLYPSPSRGATYYDPTTPEIRAMEAQRTELAKTDWNDMTPSQQDRFVKLDMKIQAAYEKQYSPTEQWSINTSIILIALAAVGMALSLIQSDRALVLSNGVLLGGIFTMAYGTGWAIASNTSTARFYVVAGATVATIVLGYIRLVRTKRVTKLAVEAASAEDVARVARLERQIDAATAVFANR